MSAPSRPLALLFVLAALGAIPACGSRRGGETPDGGGVPADGGGGGGLDAAPTSDGGASLDSSAARDASTTEDARARDAATMRDGGMRDAFAPDAYLLCPDEDLGTATGEGVSTGSTDTGAARFSADCASGDASPALRFAWTAPSAGSWVIDTFGSAFDTALVVLDGSCSGAELACSDDEGSDVQSRVALVATAGQSFVIVVTGYDATSSGDYTLSITSPVADETALCGNGLDDDRDGYADCQDSDCSADPACTETSCTNGLDDDGDFSTDCEDFDCSTDPACVEKCVDGIDEDLDGYIDCEDFDCYSDAACAGVELCSNSSDDDGDGSIDCLDPDCATHPDC